MLDRFDRIVEQCPVFDIEKPTGLDAFFRMAGEELAGRTGRSSDEIYEALRHREAKGSTAITPNLAVPHILIHGKEQFQILLARCREGIAFSGKAPKVRAVFLLVGTEDERNFYLYALSAIAQVAGDPDFISRWMRVRTAQGLRDVVLLGERLRP